jgi:hypothetical protein
MSETCKSRSTSKRKKMPIKNGLLHYKLIKTVFGQITVIWEEEPNFKVKRILLPTHSVNVHIKYPRITSSTNAVINDFAEDIKKFLSGEVIHFDINILDLNSCQAFKRRFSKQSTEFLGDGSQLMVR